MISNRRKFIQGITGLTTATFLLDPSASAAQVAKIPFPISCNQYTWYTFYNRDGRNWSTNLDESLAEYVKSGFTAYEPSFTSVEEVLSLGPLLKKYTLAMPSFYVNSTLHQKDEAKKSKETVLAIASAAKPLGAKLVVTNPSPLKWGSGENKNDEELAEQARNLNALGAALRKMGMTLSYHTHDVELRAAAREFHHMLQATNPENVTFCLDVHWVFRGSGNSQIALFDILKMYGSRITELHIRQSVNGVWSEVFGEGDIDYPKLVQQLKKLKVSPHLVVEQCLEKASPNKMTAIDAHREDLAQVKKIFGPII